MAEFRRGEYLISTDKTKLESQAIFDYLSQSSYWAQNRSLEVVERSICNSLCFGVYLSEKQVGFARVVTDHATFAWLCDVFILPEYQGRGLGKWLVETIASDPEIRGLFLLATKTAHELYRRYGGFTELQAPERWMSRSPKP